MKNSAERLSRFLSDPPEVQVGGIAANLARIRSFSQNPDNRAIVRGLVDETALYLRNAKVPNDSAIATDLAQLRTRLELWVAILTDPTASPESLASVADQAGKWSQRLIEGTGLLR